MHCRCGNLQSSAGAGSGSLISRETLLVEFHGRAMMRMSRTEDDEQQHSGGRGLGPGSPGWTWADLDLDMDLQRGLAGLPKTTTQWPTPC